MHCIDFKPIFYVLIFVLFNILHCLCFSKTHEKNKQRMKPIHYDKNQHNFLRKFTKLIQVEHVISYMLNHRTLGRHYLKKRKNLQIVKSCLNMKLSASN